MWAPGVTDRDDADRWKTLDAGVHYRLQGESQFQTRYVKEVGSSGNNTVYRIARLRRRAVTVAAQPMSKTVFVLPLLLLSNIASAARYTKIANDGSALAATVALGTAPKSWACTRDETTGLVWEVKTPENKNGSRSQKRWSTIRRS